MFQRSQRRTNFFSCSPSKRLVELGRRLRFENLERRDLLATITVNSLLDNGDGANTTLREAISAAASDDTIDFSVTGTINLTTAGSGHLVIDKNLTIQGPGADQLTIRAFDPNPNENNDGDGSHRVFYVHNNSSSLVNVTISGLTLTNGDPEDGDMDTNVGGAINNRENLTLIECILTGNYSFNGGAIYSRSGNLQIIDSTISGNTTEDGGALLLESATATIVRSTLHSNAANNDGGAIKTRGASDLTIIDSTISGNVAGLYGGGVNSSGYLTVTGSTISGNSADVAGGGIYSDTLDPVVVAYSTISGNMVGSGGHGGGLSTPGDIEMNHTIVAGNLRGTSTRDDVSTEDTIEGGNPGSFAALYSLVGDKRSANVTNEGGSLIGTSSLPINAMLGLLADNGGPTMTHALLVGSPAIDAGDNAAEAGENGVPLFDQRGAGFSRVVDGNADGNSNIDIGAFESPFPGPELAGDYNLDGGVNAADYVMWRKTFGASVSQYEGADGNGDTMVDNGDYPVWSENFGETLPLGSGSSDEVTAVASTFTSPPVTFTWFDSSPTDEYTRVKRVQSKSIAMEANTIAHLLLAIDSPIAERSEPFGEQPSEADNDQPATQDRALDQLFDEFSDEFVVAWIGS